MNCEEISCLSAFDLAAAVRAKKLSPVEITAALLDRIERLNPAINAYCIVLDVAAREAARAAEQAVMRGERLGPLHGVPISVKDNIWVHNARTTFGSHLMEENVTTADAPAVERLRKAGAIILGHTNTPEFAWKGVTDNRLFGVTRNPWNTKLTPGGSSGGAGAAVAAGLGPIGLGTDGGGSLRIPASFCGAVGFKPSFGRVPNWPPTMVDTVRHTGPLTRTVTDAALTLQTIAGPDERDPVSSPASDVDWLEAMRKGIEGLRIAYSPDLGSATVDPEVAKLCQAAALRLKEAGAHVEEVELDWPDPYDAWSMLFHGGLAASLIDRLALQGDKLDPGLKRIIERSLKTSANDVFRAQAARSAFWQKVRVLYEKFDLLASPALAVLPFPVGQDEADADDAEAESLHWTRFTYPFNLTGQPAIGVPCGWSKAGLPVGLQFVGRRNDDATVLRAAYAWEQLAPWANRWPSVPG